MELSQARGKLFAVGGAEDKEGDCTVLKEFLKAAKGPRARVVVMTVATDEPEEARREWLGVFRRLGVDDVEVVDVSARADAESAQSLEKIERATGLYFTGGDQLHITSLLGGTRMHRLIQDRYERGLVVVGGTSAGAAMMSNTMIIEGDPEVNPRFEGVSMAPGLDLFIGCIIDTHFSQRGRHGRLLTAVAHYPQELGFGIDENTAMVVDKTEFRVVGEGAVTVIDAGGMSYTNVPYAEKRDGLSLFDVKLHVLAGGARFDLAAREPVIENGETKKKKVEPGGSKNSDGSKNKGSRKGKN